MILERTVWAKKYSWQTEYSYHLYERELDMADQGFVRVEDVAIVLTEPSPHELLMGDIAAHRAELQRMKADAAKAIMEQEARINNLLALSYDLEGGVK